MKKMEIQTFKKDVEQFRDLFQSDAHEVAKQSVRLEKKGAVGLLIFDLVGEKANKLSTPIMLRLAEVLLEVSSDRSLKSLVLVSRKPTIFIAGADITEISKMTSGEMKPETLMKLQAVHTFLEELPIPSIAAIHGACMGGGTELALSCDYRICSDAPETRIGLPEVQLGIMPGWGGTQRLPRLLGLEKSLDLILSGRHIDGKSAKKLGLVDKIAPYEVLETKALEWAEKLGESGEKRERSHQLSRIALERVPGGKWVIFDQAKKKLLEKTKGNYPAPLKALEVIRRTYGGDLHEGLQEEARAFTELLGTPESKNLTQLFFLTERVRKDKGVATSAPVREIRRTAVLGAGVMGGGISQLFAAKGYRVRMRDLNWEAIRKGYQAAYRVFKKLVDRRKMKQSELDNKMAMIEGTTSLKGLRGVDLVVEAVVEDLEIKKRVLAEVESQVAEDAIICTNTSSLSVSQMATNCSNPGRVVGMHFFNPVDKMPLVEVVRGEKSSDGAVATVFAFAKKVGKTPILVKDSPGFLVNRILGPYLNEAVQLLLEGVSAREIDEAMERFGMPMGPCELLDEVGLDIAAKVSKVLYGAFGSRMKPPSFMDWVVSEKRLGKKTGRGIYVWDGKKKSEDATLTSKVKHTQVVIENNTSNIQKRLVYLMVNEGARCLSEGVVRDAAEVDIGMIFGTGFAPFRGGLLRYADSVGIESIASELEMFAGKLGERYQPCEALREMAVAGKRFF